MTLEDGYTLKVGNIVDPHGGINTGSNKTGSDGIEVEVKYLICMSLKN